MALAVSFFVTTSPHSEKTRSLGTDVAGVQRNRIAGGGQAPVGIEPARLQLHDMCCYHSATEASYF